MSTIKEFFKLKMGNNPRINDEEIDGGRRDGENDNPYLSARRTWNDHMRSVQASRNMWQILALLCLLIALAGIVVRNSLILVEFITQARAQGYAIKEALIQAGAIRMRPILLTAGTTLLGNLVIILDPVFSGLALAIIFGIIASTLFTLIVVPVVYFMVFENSQTIEGPK